MAKDIKLISGDSMKLTVTVTESDGSIVDLTNATAIKFGFSGVLKELGTGITVIDAIGGVFEVELLPADTEATSGNYPYECKLTDSTGRVSTVLNGLMIIKKSVI
ncbi:BppU family phage baseplate upper protein [Gracilibacillus lacisalsi]|uniref:BppU family phage baseplate upper protein n=1 Tax=Gracilibacillus lacisalsi TaxID=393087 RepID=UPI00037403AD|nr:BppU family phage baseplate upper protein [Gracilibacillus lacisalsi]